ADAAALTAAVAPPEDPAVAREVHALRETLARAQAHELTGRFADGLALATSVGARTEALAYKPLAIEAKFREGSLLLETGRAPDADAALTEALYGGLAAGHDEYAAEALAKRLFLKVELLGDVEAGRRDLPLAEALAERMEPLPRVRARILNSEGVLFDRLGEPDRALALYDASIAARRDLEGADEDPELIYALLNVASVAREQGRYAASTRSLQDALPKLAALIGEANPNYARAQTTMAHNLLDEGRLAQAEAAARRSIEIVEQAVGEGSIDLWLPRWILGRVALSRRDDAAARAEFERSLAALERGPGLASPIAVRHLQGLGDARIAGGSFEAGLAEHRRAFAVVAEALGPDHPYTADAHRTVGDALLATSAVPEALAEYATALAIYERALGPEANQVAWTLERIGRAKRLGGDAAGAREALTRSLSLLEATLPEESPHIADVARELGELALTEGRVDDAESSLARAVAIYRGLRDQGDPTLAMTRFALARARAGRDREAARTLAGEARAALTAAGPKFSTEADEIGRWLASS
ncbi:MAG: tetratricopeptide repeat protein, partial [Nannocystaceae bacterium]